MCKLASIFTPMKNWMLILLCLPFWAAAQWQLSDRAEIHIVTCGPYQGELYSAFGHSAIRVKDPLNNFDLIYNYGVFNFNQPHFYLNFAKGHLNYQLAVSYYEPFKNFYVRENRYIHEQVLNLSTGQKQKLFDFLQWNALPENKEYSYDYFYDNCATRVRDAVANTFKDSVRFDGSYVKTDYTIRDLCDLYLVHQAWGDLGIDLCLGLPMDKKASPYEYMYLPDYIESGFEHAQILQEGSWQPLVKETVLTYEAHPEEQHLNVWTPFVFFMLLLIFGLWLTWRGYKKARASTGFDVVLFSVTGLLGWFLLALWLLTDHKAAAWNFNLLWAFPLHFPVALFFLKKHKPHFLAAYFRLMTFWYILVLLSWAFLPQDLHYSLVPLTLLLLVRSVYQSQYLKQSLPAKS